MLGGADLKVRVPFFESPPPFARHWREIRAVHSDSDLVGLCNHLVQKNRIAKRLEDLDPARKSVFDSPPQLLFLATIPKRFDFREIVFSAVTDCLLSFHMSVESDIVDSPLASNSTERNW